MTLNDLRDLENEVKVMRFYLVLCLTLVPLCTKFSETLSNSSSDIKWKPSQMTLNDLRNLENKVKVTRFELGLCFILGHFCNKSGKSQSNISSDIKWKSFSMTFTTLKMRSRSRGSILVSACTLVPLCTTFSETVK